MRRGEVKLLSERAEARSLAARRSVGIGMGVGTGMGMKTGMDVRCVTSAPKYSVYLRLTRGSSTPHQRVINPHQRGDLRLHQKYCLRLTRGIIYASAEGRNTPPPEESSMPHQRDRLRLTRAAYLEQRAPSGVSHRVDLGGGSIDRLGHLKRESELS